MTFQIRSLIVLSLAFLASACNVKSEDRTCIYNNVQIDCAEMDARTKPAPAPTPRSVPEQKQPSTPVQKPAPTDPNKYTECLDAADKAQLFRDQIATVCSRPNSFSAMCIGAADKAQLFREQIMTVCTDSKADSAACIESADKHGLTRDQIVNLCK